MGTPLIQRKDTILATTIEVINEYGIQAFSTREVAKREGVSEAAIFKHFPRKIDLLLAVLNYFTLYDEDIIESAKMKNLGPLDALLYMTELYTRYYENYPAITSIYLSYDVLSLDPELSPKVQTVLSIRTQFISEKFNAAIEQGLLNPSLKTELLVETLLGTLKEICFEWRLSKYEFPLCKKSMEAVHMLLGAFMSYIKEY
ncbi:MAG: TetR/AcrR family transcriptional regulator [Clostridia bacterium]|nr:TetR/AcrR family transcriptional regulator [Clostridia bacterium]